jgi:UDP-N-acetylmuramyl tripeptide synthase
VAVTECSLHKEAFGLPVLVLFLLNNAAAAAAVVACVQVDYKGLVKAVEDMGPEEFATLDLDKLLATYSS